jgi:DNA-binding Lrp family transcriptional regulator
MRLTELEEQVLEVLSINGDISLKVLAHQVRAKAHQCRYAIERLFTRGLLERRVVINTFRLGYFVCGICFNISPSARNVRAKLIEFLTRSPIVGYIGAYSGEYEFRLDLYVRSIQEVHTFLSQLSEKFGEVMNTRGITFVTEIWDLPLTLSNPTARASTGLRIGEEGEQQEITSQDHQILRVIGSIKDESHASIARRLKIPVATLEYRIKKLQEKGIIVGYQVWTRPESMDAVGYQSFVHRIRLSRQDRSVYSKLLQFVHKDESVFSYTRGVGDFDVEVCSYNRSATQERKFVERLEVALGDALKERKSSAIVQHYKVHNYPFDG